MSKSITTSMAMPVDQRIRDDFEIIGSFIIDKFFNSLFAVAGDKITKKQYKTMPESYKAASKEYIDLLAINPDSIISFKKSMRAHFANYDHQQMSVTEFEDRILRIFLPSSMLVGLTGEEKDKFTNQILLKSVQNFYMIIHTPGAEWVRKITEDRKNRDNISELQDKILMILTMQRDNYVLSLQQLHKKGDKPGDSALNVKMGEEIRNLVARNAQLEKEKEKAITIIKVMRGKFDRLNTIVMDKDKQLADLKSELSALRAEKDSFGNILKEKDDALARSEEAARRRAEEEDRRRKIEEDKMRKIEEELIRNEEKRAQLAEEEKAARKEEKKVSFVEEEKPARGEEKRDPPARETEEREAEDPQKEEGSLSLLLGDKKEMSDDDDDLDSWLK